MLNIADYLKIAKAAKLLGVSQNTLRAWADSGRIVVHINPANGYRLFCRRDLESFLESIEKPNRARPK
jgi:excisionase family DNA binding protein